MAPITPLTPEDVYDLWEDGSNACIVEIDGKQYNFEDLPTCEFCGEYIVDGEDGRYICDECMEDCKADDRHIRLERNANVL